MEHCAKSELHLRSRSELLLETPVPTRAIECFSGLVAWTGTGLE
jgi:hypothetical protein